MFDGEIVKKKFPFKKILDLENLWSKTESKTKLDLENFHQIFFFFVKSLKLSCLMEKLWKKNPVKKNFVSDFQCSFFICLGPFDAYHH